MKNGKKNLVEDQLMGDGFNNFLAKLGMQTENLAATGTYTYGSLISRNHVQLEAIYRSSWIAGQVVDTVAEDMTKEGISMMSKMSPDEVQEIQSKITELGIWQKLCSTIKWARLYGGAIAVILTDGADYEKPLDVKKIGKDSFKGLAVFDRWQLEPSFGDLITEMCPEMGMPRYYTILPSMETMSAMKVHYSRIIRLDGIEMPYWQKKWDNLWGMSVIERLLDRLMAFDSATQGAAQLMYKAHLRVVQINGLRQALATGGKTEQAVVKMFQYMRLMQTNEGITLLDSEDTFTPHTYTFAGVNDVLIQFGQQISGAANIPLVRLFGQSPSGFSTGDTDLRNYYDNINKLQEKDLRTPIFKVLDIMSMSIHGKPLPDDFEYDFVSLWQLSEMEKSQIAASDTTAINTAYQSNMITKKISMKELSQQSHVTGRFSNITDEDIENAVEEPAEVPGAGGEEGGVVPSPNQNVSFEQLEQELAKLPGPPDEELETDAPEDVSLEQLAAEANALGDKRSLEELEVELNNLDAPSLEELHDVVLNIGDPSLESLENQLNKLPDNNGGKKITIDRRKLKRGLSIVRDTDFKEEEHPRGKGEKGGQFVKKGEGGEGPARESKKVASKKVSSDYAELKPVEKKIADKYISQEQANELFSLDGYKADVHYSISGDDDYNNVEMTCMAYDESQPSYEKSKKRIKIDIAFDSTESGNMDLVEAVFDGVQNNGIAKNAMKQIIDIAQKSGKKSLTLLADISIGRYAWARLGFELKDGKAKLEKIKNTLRDYGKEVLKLSGNENLFEKLDDQISYISSIKDVADFVFPNTEFSKAELRKIQGDYQYYNPDVPLDLKMHLGKHFLTNQALQGYTSWYGKMNLKKRNLDYVRDAAEESSETEVKNLLFITNEKRGVKEGETDAPFFADLLKEETEPTKDDAKFEEREHPRKKGKFTKKGTGESSSKSSSSGKSDVEKQFQKATEHKEKIKEQKKQNKELTPEQKKQVEIKRKLLAAKIEMKKAKPMSKFDNPKEFKEQGIRRTKKTQNYEVAHKDADNKFVDSKGKPLPAHIQAVGIPPNWENVLFTRDPNAGMYVYAKDKKYSWQAKYNPNFTSKTTISKFSRVAELDEKFNQIKNEVEEKMKSSDSLEKENSSVIRLVLAIGIRPGSEADTGTDEPHYGASTLEARHIVQEPDGVHLKYIGKKAVPIDILVEDKTLANILVNRAKGIAPNEKIFGTNYQKVRKFTNNLDGGGFTPKDFRTLLATKTALRLVDQLNVVPKTFEEYQDLMIKVSTIVSDRLGNEYDVCWEKYINPIVWSKWRAYLESAGVKIPEGKKQLQKGRVSKKKLTDAVKKMKSKKAGK